MSILFIVIVVAVHDGVVKVLPIEQLFIRLGNSGRQVAAAAASRASRQNAPVVLKRAAALSVVVFFTAIGRIVELVLVRLLGPAPRLAARVDDEKLGGSLAPRGVRPRLWAARSPEGDVPATCER
jgi:hypothetical protein